jgi:hypothetical protein
MTPVTRNCEYCNEPFEPTPGPMASKQRFCCTKHRVYASRDGLYADTADHKPGAETEQDTSISAALRAADAFTPVHIADHKTVAAIKIRRRHKDPSTWEATIPPNSTLAASKIREALVSHIGDLITLANKLRQPDEPLHHLATRKR